VVTAVLAAHDPEPSAAPKRLTLLGATGSIGRSTLAVVAERPQAFALEAVVAYRNAEALARIAVAHRARLAVIGDPAAYGALKSALAGSGIKAAAGPDAVSEAASRPVDIVLAAIVGAVGLAPTLAAIRAGSTVALANKECLVCAGHLFMRAAEEGGVAILPVDSEHNAVFQALAGHRKADVERIVLTASGGPFRRATPAEMAAATPARALKHPNWSMGPKITIDSATLMNKGLELIEAHHLFAVEPARLDVLVHPQSVVHGMVVYRDGSVIAQMGAPDMRTPIAHCLAYPERAPSASARLDLAAIGTLTFEKPDRARFPALDLAYAALAAGGGAANILNAANEVAVAAFLGGAIGFQQIAPMVADTIERAGSLALDRAPATVDEALMLDREGRRLAADVLERLRAG
jgi:1-deoxy-D-xylulose-5-phosphate reductoisomerase